MDGFSESTQDIVFDQMVASNRVYRQMHKGLSGPQHLTPESIVKPFIEPRLQRSVAPHSYEAMTISRLTLPQSKVQASFKAPEAV